MQRPTAVTVFGVLNIISSPLSFLDLSLSDLSLLVPGIARGFGPQILQTMPSPPFLLVWTLVRIWVRPIGSLVLLLSGIALLRTKPWARVTAIGYGVYRSFASAVGFVIIMVFVVPAMSRMPGSGGTAGSALLAMTMFGAVLDTAVSLSYYILLIFFLTRRNVVDAFRPKATPM